MGRSRPSEVGALPSGKIIFYGNSSKSKVPKDPKLNKSEDEGSANSLPPTTSQENKAKGPGLDKSKSERGAKLSPSTFQDDKLQKPKLNESKARPEARQRLSIPSQYDVTSPSPGIMNKSLSLLLSGGDFGDKSLKASVPPKLGSSDKPNLGSAVYSASRNNATTALTLIQTTLVLIQHAPYVKILAGFVQQIIQIANEVQTNKARSIELIDKVIVYACVIFEALQNPQICAGSALAGLREDLERIAEILNNIYDIFRPSLDKALSARINRVIHREDNLARIEEQDRRLDTSIISFQLKSSIVLRTFGANPGTLKAEPPPSLIHTRRVATLRPKPQIMFGREHEIENLVTTIMGSNKSRLAILGPGGIGKTSLALSVLHDSRIESHFGGHRLFVSCEAATCADHIILDMALALHIAPEGINGQILDTVIDHLRQSHFLIILDNFETPWEPSGGRENVEALLQNLTNLENIAMLITMRGSQHPAGVEWTQLLPPLQPVDLASATAIFETISKKADEHAIKLIQAVDCMPLAVTLLANLAAVDSETTEMLFQRWREENVTMVESGNSRLTCLERSVQLSISSPRMRHDPNALPFLSLLALLPGGMSEKTYTYFVNKIPGISNLKKAVSTLRQNALVFVDADNTIRILSPIRLYVRARHPPPPEARCFLQNYFLDLAFQGTSHDDQVLKHRLRTETENIEAMLVDALQFGRPLGTVVDAILTFCHFTYINSVSSTEGIRLAVEMLENVSSSNTGPHDARWIRVSGDFWRIPRLLRLEGTHLRKHNTQKQRLDSKMSRENLNTKLHADCLGCWGQILTRQSQFSEAEAKFSLASKLHLRAGDIAGYAYDLHNLGCLLSRKPTAFGEAREKFQEAIKFHEQVKDKVGNAYDLIGLGQVYLQRSEISQARDLFANALRLFTACDNELGVAFALNGLGQTALHSSRLKESEDYFSRAQKFNIKAGNSFEEAENLAGLAVTLLLRSRFADAKFRIEEALAIRAPAEDPDHLHILGCVLIAQCDFEQAERVIRKAQALHDKADNELGSADDRRFLCYTLAYNGNLERTENELIELHQVYRKQDNVLGRADVMSALGMVLIHRSKLDMASEYLENALKLHQEVGSIRCSAYDLHQIGRLCLRRGEIDLATVTLQEALRLHIEIENVQGQANDLNKLAEVSLRCQRYDEALMNVCRALALHIQIGDLMGQGDDLYMQACIFLERSRLAQAEETILRALELHTQCGFPFNKAHDLVTLSSVFWQKYKHNGAAECANEAVSALQRAINMFDAAGTPGYSDICQRRLHEIEVEVCLPDPQSRRC